MSVRDGILFIKAVGPSKGPSSLKTSVALVWVTAFMEVRPASTMRLCSSSWPQAEREGRWWWEDAAAKECGLHSGNVAKGEGNGEAGQPADR